MTKQIDLKKLAHCECSRNQLFNSVNPLYKKYYGHKSDITFQHAKDITEETAKYVSRAKDQEWAGKCILIAAIHPFPRDAADHLIKFFPANYSSSLLLSFNRFNSLRDQDEAQPEMKDIEIYRMLTKPFLSDHGYVLLPPEVFVRVIDMSEPRLFKGQEAKELHGATSHGQISSMNRNLATSMEMVWRTAAINLALFKCYDRMSNLSASILHPKLFKRIEKIFQSLSEEISETASMYRGHLSGIISIALSKKMPIATQSDRETGESVNFFLRQKTPGSATLKLVDKGLSSDSDPDPEFVLDTLHDIIASTIVSSRTCDADALFNMVTKKFAELIVHNEPIFYGHDGRRGSLPDYSGVGHIDYNARKFGATKLKRIELHIKSYQAYLDYFYSEKVGRGKRISPIVSDVWGDQNFKIVQGLGHVNHMPPNGDGKH